MCIYCMYVCMLFEEDSLTLLTVYQHSAVCVRACVRVSVHTYVKNRIRCVGGISRLLLGNMPNASFCEQPHATCKVYV